MISEKPLFMGIDAGSSKIRALIFDQKGKLISQASDSPKIYHSNIGWAHYDPQEIWETTANVIKKSLSFIDNPKRIVSVAVASVGETAIILDEKNEPIYHSIAWFDKRAKDQSEKIERIFGSDKLFKITGLVQEPIFGINKMLWLKENEPDIYKKSSKWVIIANYIAWKLSGELATDYSLACRTFAFDLNNLEWSNEIIDELKLKKSFFPDVKPTGTKLNNITNEASKLTGLSENCIVGVGGHDHPLSALITGCIQPGIMSNSIGTAECLLTGIDKPSLDLKLIDLGLVEHVIVSAEKKYYYLFGSIWTTSASIDWVKSIVAKKESYEEIIEKVKSVPPGSNGVNFFPHLRFGSPPNQVSNSRGAFTGLSTESNSSNLLRSVLEGVSLDTKNVFETMKNQTNTKYDEILTTGGATQNKLLMQIRSDVLNKKINVLNLVETVSLGAAFSGAIAAGYFANFSEIINSLDFENEIYVPNKENANFYNQLYNETFLPVLNHILKINKIILK